VRTAVAAFLSCACSAPLAADSQAFPTKPIRLVTAEIGGGADLTARLLSRALSPALGQQIITDNRPARLVGEIVAHAAADGYTLLLGASTFLNAPLLGEVRYGVQRDFAPISMVGRTPNVLVVHPSVPVKSVQELIVLAKAKPGVLNFASAAPGSSIFLAGELFKQMAGVDIVRVNYKGTGPAINDVIAGQVQMVFGTAPAVMPHVRSGRLKALGVTSAKPSPLAPGLPTVAESGLPGYESGGIYLVMAPAKTPAPIVRRLNVEIGRVLDQPEVKERFLGSGIESGPSSPQELAATITAENAKWSKVIREAGIGVKSRFTH
jgi:tripartite-type tricarboxylate transporter receptor subunit TctC